MKKILQRTKYLFIYLSLFLPLGFLQASDPGVGMTIDNPIKAKSFKELVDAILDVVIAIGTPLSILAIIFSGFLFVKARGNPDELKTAKSALTWVIVGVAVLLGAKLLSTVIKGTIENLGAGV